MAIRNGDSGRVVDGVLKTFNVTLATPRETVLGTAMNLATSAPTSGDGVVTMTVQSSDLPTINPSPYSVKYCAYLYMAGRNSSGSSVTMSYSVYKNGTSITTNQTQAGVANTNYWTHSHYRFYDVQVGDVLEARTWASATGVTLDYYALVIIPTRIELTKASIVKDLNVTLTLPSLTSGNPATNGVLNGVWDFAPTSATTAYVQLTSNFTVPSASINLSSNGFIGKIASGDASLSTNVQANATNRPYYYKSYYPSVISFREVLR